MYKITVRGKTSDDKNASKTFDKIDTPYNAELPQNAYKDFAKAALALTTLTPTTADVSYYVSVDLTD